MIESVQVRTRRWSRAEYDRLIALGIIQEDEGLWAYNVVLTLGPHDHVTPLAAPCARILVADFLP
jgi:hypothetical protein